MNMENAYKALLAKRQAAAANPIAAPAEEEYQEVAGQKQLGTLLNSLFQSQALMGSVGGKPTEQTGTDMTGYANNNLAELQAIAKRAAEQTKEKRATESHDMGMKTGEQKFQFDKEANPMRLTGMGLENEGAQLHNEFKKESNPLALQGMALNNQGQGLQNQSQSLQNQFSQQANPYKLQSMRQDLEAQKQLALRGGENPTEYDKTMSRINQMQKVQQTLKQYPEGSPEHRVLSEKYRELENGLGTMTKASLSPGEQIVEKKYANEFTDWESKGRSAAERTIAELNEVKTALSGKDDNISGGFIGRLPDWVAPDKVSLIRDKAQRIAIEGLKEALGGQFTEKDREVLTGLAYNPRLSEAANKEKVEAQIAYIEKRFGESNARSDHFKKTGYIKGFDSTSASAPASPAATSTAASSGDEQKKAAQAELRRRGLIK